MSRRGATRVPPRGAVACTTMYVRGWAGMGRRSVDGGDARRHSGPRCVWQAVFTWRAGNAPQGLNNPLRVAPPVPSAQPTALVAEGRRWVGFLDARGGRGRLDAWPRFRRTAPTSNTPWLSSPCSRVLCRALLLLCRVSVSPSRAISPCLTAVPSMRRDCAPCLLSAVGGRRVRSGCASPAHGYVLVMLLPWKSCGTVALRKGPAA